MPGSAHFHPARNCFNGWPYAPRTPVSGISEPPRKSGSRKKNSTHPKTTPHQKNVSVRKPTRNRNSASIHFATPENAAMPAISFSRSAYRTATILAVQHRTPAVSQKARAGFQKPVPSKPLPSDKQCGSAMPRKAKRVSCTKPFQRSEPRASPPN